MNSEQSKTATAASQENVPFLEHRIPRDGHSLYAKEYLGAGPAFVMLHGFPDNHRIYDPLAQFLANAGRHVVTFDFLGFGSSDKPDGYDYGYDQQVADLATVVDYLGLEQAVPVGHDVGGFAAINYLLTAPKKVVHLCLLNTFYALTPTLRPPELIQFFATPGVNEIARRMALDLQQMDFLLTFQQTQFKLGASTEQKLVIDEVVRPIISENFGPVTNSAPAFAKLTGALFPQLQKNAASLPLLKAGAAPCTIIWGSGDGYLNTGVAQDFATLFAGSTLHLLDGGHWPQLDLPEQVGRLLLNDVQTAR